jgi:hypothetical protein
MLFSRSVRVAAGLAVATVALATGASGASGTAPRTTTDPATAAAGWLAQQLVDGTHLVYAFDGKTFDGGGTADTIYALAAAKSGRSTLEAATGYLAAHVEDYVDINNTTGYGPSDGAIGKTAIAAFVAGADPTHFGGPNLLAQLKKDECTSASSSCPAAGAAANIFASISESLVLIAEARGAALDAKYAPSPAAVSYLLSLQCPNGGFTSDTSTAKGCSSDVDATGYAMMALRALGTQSSALNRAADWLISTRASNGSWSSQGAANVDSTGLAAAGLHAAGRSADSSRHWLAGQQVTTGPTLGAGASRGALKYLGKFDAASSIKGTADGLLGLVPGADLATLTAAGSAAGTAVLALAAPSLRHPTITAGRLQTVTGTGFSAGETVRAVTRGYAATARADRAGSVSFSFRAPAAGERIVTLTGRTSALATHASYRVDAPAVVSTAPSTAPTTAAPAPAPVSSAAPVLADTGRNDATIRAEILLGAACVALGGVALLLGRRQGRRR